MPDDTVMSIDIFQDHRGSNDLNRYPEFFVKFPHQRIPPAFAEFQPPAKRSHAFDAAIVILDFARQEETVPPGEAERLTSILCDGRQVCIG